MKAFVSIMGGGRGITVLEGGISTALSTTSAIVNTSNDTTLSDTSVVNTGGSDFSVAIYSADDTPVVRRVDAKATGATSSYAVFNNGSASFVLNDIRATAKGTTNS